LGEWQKKRKQVLVDLEMAQMPATQEIVARIKKLNATIEYAREELQKLLPITRRCMDDYLNAQTKCRELKLQMEASTTENERLTLRTQWMRQREVLEAAETAWDRQLEIEEPIDDLKTGSNIDLRELENSIRMRTLNEHEPDQELNPNQERQRRAFIMKCPRQECLGYLSTRYMCGLCQHKVCPDCHDALDQKHKCDPDKVETIKLIQREGKPCPKCGCIICKIDGCDQMWCTQCKTAFSWKTGHIETGRIHNPEYFRWMRDHGMEAPRLDQPICNPRAVNMQEMQKIRGTYKSLNDSDLSCATYIYHVALTLSTMPDISLAPESNIDLRVNFLMGKINRADMEKCIITRDRTRFKQQYRRDLLQMVMQVFSDIALRAVQAINTPHYCDILRQSYTEAYELIQYHNRMVKQFHQDHKLKIPELLIRFHDV
jgi:hypothetical protein